MTPLDRSTSGIKLASLGSPGTIPDNIAEWLSETTARYDDIIGPLSSIFWLQGLEFLNELIDGPVYALEDEIVNPPQVFERLPRHLTKVTLSGQGCDTTVRFWTGDS